MRFRDAHKEEWKQQQATLRVERKQRGLCVKCGRPAVSGLTLCSHDLDLGRKRTRRYASTRGKQLAEQQRADYLKRVNNGCCVECGEKARPGRVKCAKHGEIDRRKQLKHLYGITMEQVEEMVHAQNGACAICGSLAKLDVDHHHGTRKVLSLLCRKCNTALGLFDHNPDTFAKAMAYIQKHYVTPPTS